MLGARVRVAWHGGFLKRGLAAYSTSIGTRSNPLTDNVPKRVRRGLFTRGRRHSKW